MEWFEYIIIIIALGIVILPIFLKIKYKTAGKKCSSCCCCPYKEQCNKQTSKNNKTI